MVMDMAMHRGITLHRLSISVSDSAAMVADGVIKALSHEHFLAA